MQPGDALSTVVQVAVALAGFAGVVVAFRHGSLHDWPAIDRFRLWLLLVNALVPLVASLFGILLLTIEPVPVSIWRCCSGFLLIVGMSFIFAGRRRLDQVGPAGINALGSFRFFFYLIGACTIAVWLLQFYNMVRAGLFWIFLAGVVFQLAVGTLQFARMVLLPPPPET